MNKLIEIIMLIGLVLFLVLISFVIHKSTKPVHHNHLEQKIEQSVAKQEKIKDSIQVIDSNLISIEPVIKKARKKYEDLKNKPSFSYLDSAAVHQLDSFWATYQTDWADNQRKR